MQSKDDLNRRNGQKAQSELTGKGEISGKDNGPNKPIRLYRAKAKSRKGLVRKLFADFVASQVKSYGQE